MLKMWGGQDERSKQIDSLRQGFSTVKELQKNSLYEVPVTLPSRKVITLRINLPPDFPKVGPIIQVVPPVQHRLIDPQMYIIPQAHDNLQRWTQQASLGKTVFEIVQKLMQDPPQILQNPLNPGPQPPYPYGTPNNVMPQNTMINNPNKPPPVYMSPSNGTMQPQQHQQPQQYPQQMQQQQQSQYLQQQHSQYPQQVQQPQQQQLPGNMHHREQTHTPQPVVPASFPELESKTPTELAQLLNDETEFNKFFENLPAVQNMKKVRDDLRNNNEELAKKTLAKESEIEKLKKELASSNEIIQQQKLAFESKAQRQQEILKQFSTQNLVDKLTYAAHEAEVSSDDLANRFLSGEMDYKDFIKEFMEKRKLFHLRSAKKESLMMISR